MIQLQFDQLSKVRPRKIVCENSAEFFDLCRRATRGDLDILSVSRGEGNGQWIVNVWYDN